MSTDLQSNAIEPETKSSRVRLPSGEAMTTSDANEITRARETSLVVVAGSPESGKTTLLASLLHCFQRGPYADHFFAGSHTLVGFDQRCHLGRTRSRLAEPDTPRTKVGDPRRILHLRLTDKVFQSKDLLLTDISGEVYEDIRHSVDECRRFKLFSRADYIVLLVDGERLADSGERHAARIEVLQMLQCMFDAGHLDQHTWLDVLIAKCDLMTTKTAQRFADSLLTDIRSKYEGLLATLRCQHIAARPNIETEEFHLGYGVEAVLPAWLNRRVRSVDLRKRARPVATLSEFDKFLERHSPEFVVESSP